MKFSKWHIAPAEEADIRRLGEAGYPQLVSQVLAARGISTAEEAAAFLEHEQRLTYSPFLMADMDKAVERVQRALADRWSASAGPSVRVAAWRCSGITTWTASPPR